MDKGCKAWYDVYELRIIYIKKDKELNIIKGYVMGDECRPLELDSNLLSKKAGQYLLSNLIL